MSRLREVGVELSVIPGEREAALSFLGASNDFRNEDLLFADIGGGRPRWYLVERMDRLATLCLMLRCDPHRILSTSAAAA